jgi:uncharacterized protein
MIKHKLAKILFSALLLAQTMLFAAQPDDLLDSLKPQGAVNDYAGVIDSQSRQAIAALSDELRAKTGAFLVVATVKSLEGGAIDDFANRLFERWGIGQKGEDKGLLILAAIEDRQYRIEVGYGLEGAVPDALAGRIGRELLIANFRQGRYGQGLTAAATFIAERIADDAGVELGGLPPVHKRQSLGGAEEFSLGEKIFQLIMLVVVVLFFIRHPFLALLLLSGGRGGGGGGFSGGGFGGGGMGGFGGGMSGGGGASGGW